MIRRSFVPALILLTSLVVELRAQQPAAAPRATGNVALVDVARIFKENARFKEQAEELKAEIPKASVQLEAMKRRHAELTETRKQAVNDEERAKIDRDLLKLKHEYESFQETVKLTLQRREAALYRETYEEVREVVAAHARAHGFSIVLRYSADELSDRDEPKDVLAKLNRLVVFSEAEHDITDAIIAALNGTPQ